MFPKFIFQPGKASLITFDDFVSNTGIFYGLAINLCCMNENGHILHCPDIPNVPKQVPDTA